MGLVDTQDIKDEDGNVIGFQATVDDLDYKVEYVEEDGDYISAKTKEINSFKLPKPNDAEYIRIKDVEYRIGHLRTYDKRHIVDIVRASDGYSLGREVFTDSGSYGMATTRTKSQVQKAIRKELLRLLNR